MHCVSLYCTTIRDSERERGIQPCHGAFIVGEIGRSFVVHGWIVVHALVPLSYYCCRSHYTITMLSAFTLLLLISLFLDYAKRAHELNIHTDMLARLS